MINNASRMFEDWKSLQTLDLSTFNMSETISLFAMFGDCRNLRTLNISNFNTSKVEQFDRMFYKCINLSSVDVSGFDMSSAESTLEKMENKSRGSNAATWMNYYAE